MIVPKSSDCRAKEPRTCRFHGAVLRMEVALASQDIKGYVEARDEVDRLKSHPDADFERLVNTGSSVAQTRGSLGRKDDDRDLRGEQRIAYLENSRAIPTPLEAHALWVALWLKQGGDAKYVDTNYESYSNVISGDPEIRETEKTYKTLAWNKWSPTSGHAPIPAGYGSNALCLLVLPDVVEQPMNPARKDDRREGWAWGHTEVRTLSRDEDGNLVAGTNKPSRTVGIEKDTRDYLRGKTFADLLDAFKSKESAFPAVER